MFSTRNGLYDKACKKFKLQNGIKLFTYSFYKQRKADVQAFFAHICSEAQSSKAAAGHHALARIHGMQQLRRHYTLNIDGLAAVVGMDTWHEELNPQGVTVEMHGNIRQMVCPSCEGVEPLTRASMAQMKQKEEIPCLRCGEDNMRFRVMLYDDEQASAITSDDVFEQLEEDLQVADLILWVGISFEQSASVEYFKKARHILGSNGRLAAVRQVVINPSEEPLFNLISACCNASELQVTAVRGSSDDVLTQLAERMMQHCSGHAGTGDSAVARRDVVPATADDVRPLVACNVKPAVAGDVRPTVACNVRLAVAGGVRPTVACDVRPAVVCDVRPALAQPQRCVEGLS